MDGAGFQFGWLNDPRLAAHALSPKPVWLWSTQPARILWANPVGASIFDAPSPAAATVINFWPDVAVARQIERLAATLPAGDGARLEHLRGFGAKLGGATVCLCSRMTLQNGHTAMLVIATEQPAKGLTLPERVHRLLADLQMPSAIFTADGDLIEAQPGAEAQLAGKHDLVSLDAACLAREASQTGAAQGDVAGHKATLIKLGAEPAFALLLGLMHGEDETAQVAAPAAAEQALRRQSFRFVWKMDSELRFILGVTEFARLLGSKTASLLDRPWRELAAVLGIDHDNRIAQSLAARETWSGIVVEWPVNGTGERLPIEMSGLPVFDRDRQFTGFRGFSICRDLARLAELQRARAKTLPASIFEIGPEPAKSAEPEEPRNNVMPFPLPPSPDVVAARKEPTEQPATPAQPELSPGEHNAFQELARELSARLRNRPPSEPRVAEALPAVADAPIASVEPEFESHPRTQDARPILDRVPLGILVYRFNRLLYANRAFLDWSGYTDLDALADAGGLDSLFIETNDRAADPHNGKSLTIATGDGDKNAVSGRLFSAAWNGESALVLMINTQLASAASAPAAEPIAQASNAELQQLKEEHNALQNQKNALQSENRELQAVLDTATDAVLLFDRSGAVMAANRSAEALFGYNKTELAGMPLADLFAAESGHAVMDWLDRLARSERALDSGREATGRVRQGGLVPLHITIGRIEGGEKFCAVLCDGTAWKRMEEELTNARQQAERAFTAKSEFLAKISHEIRTPLNGIIGFSEVMMNERFGPITNDRYRQYLKDIHSSGEQLIALLNELLDLSKIEAGKLDLNFVTVNLNDIVQQCVAVMQQEANWQRVIVRTALNPNLPPIIADARSVRQIALNIVSNSIKFTGAGRQTIVSTAVNDDHEVSLRVRDTGTGMSEKELQRALEPFRQLATTTRWGTSGTGLALSITKALAEANHGRFRISSEVDSGTLVEVAFPATRVLTG